MESTSTERQAAGGTEPAPIVRWVLATLSLATILSSLGNSTASVGLPVLSRAYMAPFQQVQWVVLAYLLAITSVIVSVGQLGDTIGRGRLLIGGVVVFAVASVVCAIAPSLCVLITARGVQGLGAATMLTLSLALVSETVPKERVGRAMGVLGMMSAIGTALGPSLGGVLISAFGWRALFLVNVPLCVVTITLAFRHLPMGLRSAKANRAGFDGFGTVVLTLTLAAYALAMTVGRGRFGVLNVVLLLVVAAGIALFAFAESRATSPLVRVSMLRDPQLRARLAMSAIVSTVVMASLVVGPFYLSNALGLSATWVGLAMSCGSIVAALASVPAGRFADRVGANRMTVGAVCGMAVGLIALSLLPLASGVVGYLVPLGVVTASYAVFQTANNTAVMADVDRHQRGVISGLLNLSRNLGLISGASMMGAVFARGSGTTDLASAAPDAIAAGMRSSFAVAATLMAIAILIATRGRLFPRGALLEANDAA